MRLKAVLSLQVFATRALIGRIWVRPNVVLSLQVPCMWVSCGWVGGKDGA